MGLFDFLSGSDEAERAAAATRANLGTYGTQSNQIADTYGENSLAALGTGRTNALTALGTGQTGAVDALNKGLTASTGAGQAGVAAWNDLSNLGKSYQPAIDAYYGSLGIGGAGARAAAENAFTASPGFAYQNDQAQKAIINRASALGGVFSGNTGRALTEDTRQRALSDYGSWQSKLGAFAPLQAQVTGAAASGISGANKTLADIYSQGYGGLANQFTTGGRDIAGLETGYGSDVANVAGNVAGQRAQSARDIVQGNIATNNQIAQAGQQDAANYWGAIGAGVKALGGAYGAKLA